MNTNKLTNLDQNRMWFSEKNWKMQNLDINTESDKSNLSKTNIFGKVITLL